MSMNSQAAGLFITLEGIEGAGKSTQCQGIRRQIEASGIKVRTTREPGGTELAEGIRKLLLSPELDVGAKEELLLMFAARASHLRQVIIPALNNGEWVICDRFTDASYAYQGAGRGLGQEIITALEIFVQEDLRPDMTIVFDLPVEQGMTRAKSRSVQDRFELEEISFFERIRAAYLERARNHPAGYSVINAGESLNDVTQQVESVISKLIEQHATQY